jgi:hypothetical protein
VSLYLLQMHSGGQMPIQKYAMSRYNIIEVTV